jgi:hypothetical protein
VGFVAAVVAMDFWILPASLRPGFETDMSVPELVLLYAILAGTLALGVSASRRTGSLA